MPLIMLNAGEGGIITGIGGGDEFKNYLYGLGFTVGAFVSVASRGSSGLIVGIGAARLALDESTAAKIYV